MSGGVILLISMTFFFPLGHVVPIHGMVQMFSNGTRVWLLREYVRRDFIVPYLLGLPFGIIPSVLLIKQFPYEALPLFLLATLIMYTLFRPKSFPALKISPKWFFIHGVVAAFLCLFIGAVGPFLAPFFIRDDLPKEQVVATKAAMQLFAHLIKIPSFLYLGFAYQDYFLLIVAMTAAAWLGTKYGVYLLKNLQQNWFDKLFRIFLFMAGLRLYYRVFFI